MQINLRSGQIPRQPGELRRRTADPPEPGGEGEAARAVGAAPASVTAPPVRLASSGEASLALARILEGFASGAPPSGLLFGRADGARIAALLDPGA